MILSLPLPLPSFSRTYSIATFFYLSFLLPLLCLCCDSVPTHPFASYSTKAASNLFLTFALYVHTHTHVHGCTSHPIPSLMMMSPKLILPPHFFFPIPITYNHFIQQQYDNLHFIIFNIIFILHTFQQTLTFSPHRHFIPSLHFFSILFFLVTRFHCAHTHKRDCESILLMGSSFLWFFGSRRIHTFLHHHHHLPSPFLSLLFSSYLSSPPVYSQLPS